MSDGIWFTVEEMEDLKVDQLREVLDYLGIDYSKNTAKAKLILLLKDRQDELKASDPGDPEVPRYSVRIQRIMAAKKAAEGGSK